MTSPEFLVDCVNDRGLVLGRNGDVDIPLGFVFTSIVKTRVEGSPPELRDVPMGRVAVVTLRLVEVHWYRRKIELIPRGHTAGLLLRGEGLRELHAALLHRADGEYLHLEGARGVAQQAVQRDGPASGGSAR